MKNHMTVSDNFFQLAQDRFQELGPETEYEEFDPELIIILHRLNQIKGIATTFSCGSHPPYDSNNVSEDDSLYIATVVTENGLDNLFHLHRLFTNEVYRQAGGTKNQLLDHRHDEKTLLSCFVHLDAKFQLTGAILTKRQKEKWTPLDQIYPSWVLTIDIYSLHMKNFYLDCLESALSQYHRLSGQ